MNCGKNLCNSSMDPKVLFVKQFLATLFIDEVSTIPINNALFKQGMDRMAEYFDTNKKILAHTSINLICFFLNIRHGEITVSFQK